MNSSATAAIGGGLLLGFGLPARGEVRDTLTTDAAFAPNAFLRIDRAGKVTFVMPMIEMGQGTYTSLPMLIAEALEVDVDKVAIEHSPADDKLYVNPLVGLQLTGGSTAVRAMYVPLRRAGATARVMLVRAAAQRWKVDPSTCRAENGTVMHAPTGRKLGYGGSSTPRRSSLCRRRSRSRSLPTSSSSESRTGASTAPARSTAPRSSASIPGCPG
jgi:isoquinoline 1-oxidoreductase beta subunit